ncbi:MAG: hypothetical protein CME68_11580 [Halobacteriovoraceae bacterium]|nr:hypothetical protein [Halobacteriovoraceae bacterium]
MLFLGSCTGYHFRQVKNPFSHFGIKSLSIPMFVNKSAIPNISNAFTKEIFLLLSHYSGLEVYSGMKKDKDAVLIGIISSGPKTSDVFSQSGRTFLSKETFPGRSPFYATSNTSYKLSLRIVIIKKPDPNVINLIKGPWGEQVIQNSRIVLDEKFPLTSSFVRSVSVGEEGSADSRVANFTKSKSWFQITVKELAKSISERFRKEVLNAF